MACWPACGTVYSSCDAGVKAGGLRLGEDTAVETVSRDLGDVIARLRRALSPDRVLTDESSLATYRSDGLLHYRVPPGCVVLPDSEDEVVAVVRACRDAAVPWVARGSGTGLSGACIPRANAVVVSFERMKRIVEIDTQNHMAVVEPGVTLEETPAGMLVRDPSANAILLTVSPREMALTQKGLTDERG